MNAVDSFPMMIGPASRVPADQRCRASSDALAMLLVLVANDRLRPEARRVTLDILRRAGYGPGHVAAVAAHCTTARAIERARP